MWLERTYVQVPLRLDTVRRTFQHRTVLTPAHEPAAPARVDPDESWPAVARKR
jgi:hypothetical protein